MSTSAKASWNTKHRKAVASKDLTPKMNRTLNTTGERHPANSEFDERLAKEVAGPVEVTPCGCLRCQKIVQWKRW